MNFLIAFVIIVGLLLRSTAMRRRRIGSTRVDAGSPAAASCSPATGSSRVDGVPGERRG